MNERVVMHVLPYVLMTALLAKIFNYPEKVVQVGIRKYRPRMQEEVIVCVLIQNILPRNINALFSLHLDFIPALCSRTLLILLTLWTRDDKSVR